MGSSLLTLPSKCAPEPLRFEFIPVQQQCHAWHLHAWHALLLSILYS